MFEIKDLFLNTAFYCDKKCRFCKETYLAIGGSQFKGLLMFSFTYLESRKGIFKDGVQFLLYGTFLLIVSLQILHL